MPALPSSPPLHGLGAHHKGVTAVRPNSPAANEPGGVQKSTQNGGSAGLKHSKIRGGSQSDIGEAGGRRARTREPPRDKPPSKDGTVQRTAKEVEGLKDYVGQLLAVRIIVHLGLR